MPRKSQTIVTYRPSFLRPFVRLRDRQVRLYGLFDHQFDHSFIHPLYRPASIHPSYIRPFVRTSTRCVVNPSSNLSIYLFIHPFVHSTDGAFVLLRPSRFVPGSIVSWRGGWGLCHSLPRADTHLPINQHGATKPPYLCACEPLARLNYSVSFLFHLRYATCRSPHASTVIVIVAATATATATAPQSSERDSDAVRDCSAAGRWGHDDKR